ncbi:MAG: CinA family protein [Erysipelotrichaceae bacterium]|nr:CinA family protein [Erysipelotrichaceae bacterium]
MTDEIIHLYERLVNILKERELYISTMESCTGGQVASYITDIEGSSEVIKGAYVTYSNMAKVLNGVDEDIINRYGVYSYECARSMAKACRDKYKADIGIGITGTFSNVDENNEDSIINNVFVSISFNDEYHDLGIKLNDGLKRYEAKDEVALKVAEKVLKILEKKGK